MSQIAIAGAGYVGLTTAVCFVRLGHSVRVVDIDAERVAGLSGGHVPFFEPGLEELISGGLSSSQLTFTDSYSRALDGAEFIFVCVPTPDDGLGVTDLSVVEASVRAASEFLGPSSLIVLKSTVPIGTCRQIARIVGRGDVDIVSNPEFLQAGRAVEAAFAPSRIVIGAESHEAVARVERLYVGLEAAFVLTDSASAELIKLASNSYLAVRLSYVNEIATLAHSVGASVEDVFAGMGADPRIGEDFLKPGPGWGGSCLPKDARSLVAAGIASGAQQDLVRAALDSNRKQFELVIESVGPDPASVQIAVFGLAFKAGTDDLRDSPALEIIIRLLGLGASVSAYDPQITDLNLPGLEVYSDPFGAAEGADVVLVLTGWPEFSEVDPSRLAHVMKRSVAIDACGVLDRNSFRAAGFEVTSIG